MAGSFQDSKSLFPGHDGRGSVRQLRHGARKRMKGGKMMEAIIVTGASAKEIADLVQMVRGRQMVVNAKGSNLFTEQEIRKRVCRTLEVLCLVPSCTAQEMHDTLSRLGKYDGP